MGPGSISRCFGKHGPCDAHRKTFHPVAQMLGGERP